MGNDPHKLAQIVPGGNANSTRITRGEGGGSDGRGLVHALGTLEIGARWAGAWEEGVS